MLTSISHVHLKDKTMIDQDDYCNSHHKSEQLQRKRLYSVFWGFKHVHFVPRYRGTKHFAEGWTSIIAVSAPPAIQGQVRFVHVMQLPTAVQPSQAVLSRPMKQYGKDTLSLSQLISCQTLY